MFFSKSFIVSGPTFRSFIHFQFNFVYSVREYFSCLAFQETFIEEAVFSPLYILASFVID